MGPGFEGKPVEYLSISNAQLLVATDIPPTGGERFSEWVEDWETFIDVMNYSYPKDRVAVVTHNRNIQYLYSRRSCGCFSPKLYDVAGPGFLSVHYYKDGYIAPWSERSFPPGLYLIRHGETAWGT
jgi:broad specificity phosphatase PhoE